MIVPTVAREQIPTPASPVYPSAVTDEGNGAPTGLFFTFFVVHILNQRGPHPVGSSKVSKVRLLRTLSEMVLIHDQPWHSEHFRYVVLAGPVPAKYG